MSTSQVSSTRPLAGAENRQIQVTEQPNPELQRRTRLRGRIRDSEISFLLAAGTYRVGSSETSDLVIDQTGVSRLHAHIRRHGSRVEVEDLGSRNGTFVNGRAVDRADLRTGDTLRLGPVELRVEEVDASDAELGLVLAAPDSAVVAAGADQSTIELSKSLSAIGDESLAQPLVFPPGYLPGRSPAMAKLYDQMRPLLAAELPLVIAGETGVGKEGIAQALHLSSPRRLGPFVAVNCAAIPADLLEAEMFGIGDGVATGVRRRLGKFRQAQGGTLFLDELGEMSLPLQAKLLRALQEREIEPVGERSTPVDVRVVAATNIDLMQRLEQGRFRQDLYFRVAGSVLRIPPLRQRREDIRLLIEHFLRHHAEQLGKTILGMTIKALRLMTDFSWPGNIRELEHETQRLAHLCAAGQAIDSTMLSERLSAVPEAPPHTGVWPASFLLEDHVRIAERHAILRALEHCGGSQRQAAKILGISRNTLARKIAQLAITVPIQGEADDAAAPDPHARLAEG